MKKICRIELVDDHNTPIRMFKPIYKTNSVSAKVRIQIIKNIYITEQIEASNIKLGVFCVL